MSVQVDLEHYGGIFNVLGVLPDMAMFGKAMENGYAITAVTDKIMASQ